MHIPQIVIPDPVVFIWGMIFMGIVWALWNAYCHPGEE